MGNLCTREESAVNTNNTNATTNNNNQQGGFIVAGQQPQAVSGTNSGLERRLSRSSSALSNPSTPRQVSIEDSRVNSLLYTQLIAFTLFELETITKSFRSDYILGEGGFGTVYKGYIDENVRVGLKSLAVAVKVLNKEGLQGHREWLTEVNFLGQLRHPNLVKLIGYCCEDDNRLLVYEFMFRGSLEHHLFRKASTTLPWTKRMMIAYGAAKGLAFLHNAEHPVRESWTKRERPMYQLRVLGTFGSCAPELCYDCFRVVLLELLTGRRSFDKTRPMKEQSLVDWARPKLKGKKKWLLIIDPRLEDQYSTRAAQKACILAYYCLSNNHKARPLTTNIVETLEHLQGNCTGDTSIISLDWLWQRKWRIHKTKEALLVMEYCDKSLVSVLESRGAGFFEEEHILLMFNDICNAVFAMHCQSPPIAHRDLKAKNILLGSNRL
ncbi:probable serine/threonine-protein kinase PBL8 [Tanacetum coccineum]